MKKEFKLNEKRRNELDKFFQDFIGAYFPYGKGEKQIRAVDFYKRVLEIIEKTDKEFIRLLKEKIKKEFCSTLMEEKYIERTFNKLSGDLK